MLSAFKFWIKFSKRLFYLCWNSVSKSITVGSKSNIIIINFFVVLYQIFCLNSTSCWYWLFKSVFTWKRKTYFVFRIKIFTHILIIHWRMQTLFYELKWILFVENIIVIEIIILLNITSCFLNRFFVKKLLKPIFVCFFICHLS